MKKFITSLLLMLVLLTVLFPKREWASNLNAVNQLMEEGTATVTSSGQKGEAKNKSVATTSTGSNIVGTALAEIVALLARGTEAILTMAILPDTVEGDVQWFTIEDLLMGRIKLFDINFMDIDENATDTNNIVKYNVAKWFYAIRNLALVLQLAVLIVVGILMAISSVADDKAKYKRMLGNWFASFAILFLLPLIIATMLFISNKTIDLIRGIGENLQTGTVANAKIEETGGLNFEKTLIFGKVDNNGSTQAFEGISTRIQRTTGWQKLSLAVVWAMLAYYEFKFFFMYLKRLLATGFLVVISPLITVTYPIDKARDNQAQAYKTWIKEFFLNVFIQPVHALFFLVFMYTVYGIMERAPLLAIIFMASLSRGEQLIRKIFKIERNAGFGPLRGGKKK